jgi:hypothetical protein
MVDRGDTLHRMARLRPLTDLVIVHTDGKGTRGARQDWWRAFAEVDPGTCAVRAAELLFSNQGMPNDRVAAVLQQLLEDQVVHADPIVLARISAQGDRPKVDPVNVGGMASGQG